MKSISALNFNLIPLLTTDWSHKASPQFPHSEFNLKVNAKIADLGSNIYAVKDLVWHHHHQYDSYIYADSSVLMPIQFLCFLLKLPSEAKKLSKGFVIKNHHLWDPEVLPSHSSHTLRPLLPPSSMQKDLPESLSSC